MIVLCSANTTPDAAAHINPRNVRGWRDARLYAIKACQMTGYRLRALSLAPATVDLLVEVEFPSAARRCESAANPRARSMVSIERSAESVPCRRRRRRRL